MLGWTQGTGKNGGGLALLAAAGVACMLSWWGARQTEKSFSVQLLAEQDPHPDDPRPATFNLMFTADSAYRLTPEAMFGYVHADLFELPITLNGRASSRAVANAQLQASAPPSIRVARDTSRFFNEAQLASIKARLNLTFAQQPYWPSLEAALRAIHWRRSPDKASRNAQTKSLDFDGEEVQRLTAAAAPLVMSLRADQKDEVRTLLQLMGLEQLASRF